jgi:hypothetical protein
MRARRRAGALTVASVGWASVCVGALLASLTTFNADEQTTVPCCSRSGPTFEQVDDARLRALATTVVQSRSDFGSLSEVDRRYHLDGFVRSRQICLEEFSRGPESSPLRERSESICECYAAYTAVNLTNGELHAMLDGKDISDITPSIRSKYATAGKTCFPKLNQPTNGE